MSSRESIYTTERNRKISITLKGKKKTAEHRKNISLGHLGHKVSPETRAKISASNKGKKMSQEVRQKMSKSKTGKKHSAEHRRKISLAMKGAKTNLWRGGLTEINASIRNTVDYRLWREAVFQRDDYTCQFCSQHGGDMQADHIKPFAYFPELRFAIDNGRTLCKACHRTTETYGRKMKVKGNKNKVKSLKG